MSHLLRSILIDASQSSLQIHVLFFGHVVICSFQLFQVFATMEGDDLFNAILTWLSEVELHVTLASGVVDLDCL